MLCSPKPPPNLPAYIEHRVIAKLGYTEYSLFILFALWHVIETDFALIIQDDGWVLDAANWRDEFFNYDYIGAPTCHGRVDTATGTQWLASFEWWDHLNKPGSSVYPILNGGFSLRSKRMLRVFIDHPQLEIKIPRPNSLAFNPLRMRWRSYAPNEDAQLSAILRPQLEKLGIKYAPIDLCCHFSAEDTGPYYNEMDFQNLFGHHASWRRLISIDPPTVQYRLTRNIVQQARRERDIVRMFEDRGYIVQFPE
ncbi:hypothetical protein GCM10010970_13790 [Silvimonas iriomotensis]|uniref:DUF5672 domain-containing protein n=1 Tax=Silvimonas iriomotensis TaxID=449662 RepID=A0ABQ2P7A7_9NEIS|nr:hypothetical protein GCM10010970_13790 [Silvimonas iriomotensis]